MPKILFHFCALLFVAAIAAAQGIDAADGGDTGVFEFSTVDVFKEFRKQTLPVVSANRRGVFVETDKGPKRQKYGARGLTFRPTSARSSVMVEATEIEFELANFAAERRQAAVEGAIAEGAEEAQDFSDRVSTAPASRQAVLLGPGQTVESVNADSVDAWDQANNVAAPAALNSETSQFADRIFFELTLTPDQSVEDVVAAIVLRHNRVDHRGRPTGGTSTTLSLEKVGDLEADAANKVLFSASFQEQFVSGLRVQVHLFDGNMTPLASNLAGPLRELPASQL